MDIFTAKVLVSAMIGVVIGGIGMEILNRKNPEFVKKVEDKINEAGNAVKYAFRGVVVEEA
ncbi:hypothetical protein LCGC14_2429780 [marine sediment metagenome]|uniref:Uncharacterized protein n=1 Tax=marine sediment metagenome TaxID=412755 RepID=A0A0F9BME9_9ZZZZ|nr:hypothetical protein [Candidatus Scalindua sediminis]HDY67703.1 hypothetical protein [Candidatus Scalindua sp.]